MKSHNDTNSLHLSAYKPGLPAVSDILVRIALTPDTFLVLECSPSSGISLLQGIYERFRIPSALAYYFFSVNTFTVPYFGSTLRCSGLFTRTNG
jgi:hypothetical protein